MTQKTQLTEVHLGHHKKIEKVMACKHETYVNFHHDFKYQWIVEFIPGQNTDIFQCGINTFDENNIL